MVACREINQVAGNVGNMEIQEYVRLEHTED
jgi:hypothetical protein